MSGHVFQSLFQYVPVNIQSICSVYGFMSSLNHLGIQRSCFCLSFLAALCFSSSRIFSIVAVSKSPFSNARQSGLNLESVGGNVALSYSWSSFNCIAYVVKLYICLLLGGRS